VHAHAGHGDPPAEPGLAKWAWLSIAAAVSTIGLKSGAYLITGSVGLLSDALESVVNLVAAVLALIAIRIAARPADDTHHFGHGKVEYFSAGAEGLMIVVAAVLIVYSAVQRLLDPQPLEALGVGLAITVVATVINAVVGALVMRAGKRHRSITLVADGKHLLTDVWTSIGVVVGVGIVAITGWLALDSIVAIGVAVNILWTGGVLVRHSTHGLMDHALPQPDVDVLVQVLRDVSRDYPRGEVDFHAVQTRESGRQRFVSMHVLVPGSWTVERGHDLLEQIETDVIAALPGSHVHTHLEPREDPRSYEDGTGGFEVSADEEVSADGADSA
jgi:cation diffusion facilitator family transporter